MTGAPYDLIVRAGRLVCPESGLDGPGAVAIRGDRIVATLSGADEITAASAHCEGVFAGDLVWPGLVDLHAHPDPGTSLFGVDPDRFMLARGVTTVLSQGDAGARNWPDYRERVIGGVRTRVISALNLAACGETRPGCFSDVEEADVDACVRTIEEAGGAIWGIAVNVYETTCGDSDPREITRRALEAAERTGRPLLFGTRGSSDWPLDEQLGMLRAGDVVTYCLHGWGQQIVQEGRVRDCVWDARERGVRFDVGHGFGSFDFRVAEAAISEGFLPDTISTDLQRRHIGGVPQHDLLLVMSKLRAAGMSEAELLPRVTCRPAEVLNRSGALGSLAEGACADISVVRWNAGSFALRDVSGRERLGGVWEPVFTIRAGQVVEPLEGSRRTARSRRDARAAESA